MLKVLVFPSCNEPGLEIIQSLIKSNKVEVFGGSSEEQLFDPSRSILHHHEQISGLHQENFPVDFGNFLLEKKIDLVFPTTDSLVAEFSKWKHSPVRFITPSEECAHIVMSKSATYRKLRDVVPVPEVFEGKNLKFPAYAKPDVGSGSRGAMRIHNPNELDLARQLRLLVTEYLPGDECTVDCVSDLSGNLMFASPRRRGKISRGIAIGSQSFESKEIQAWVHAASTTLKIAGPWFAQFKKDREGRYKLLEINARVAGSMGLTRLSGVNIPLISVFMYAGYPVQVPPLQEQIIVNRTLSSWVDAAPYDTVIWDLDDTLVRKDGKADPMMMAHLFDCYNRGITQLLLSKNKNIESVLENARIPNIFTRIFGTDDKLQALAKIIKLFSLNLDTLVLVNDSYSEMLAFQSALPGVRIVTPADVDRLGWERIR